MGYVYNSARYKRWRQLIFCRDNYTCQLCGAQGSLNAHHIKKKSTNSALAYFKSNGITLCVKCHIVITTKEELFEHLFTLIVGHKLTLEYVYAFFSFLCSQYDKIVSDFKKANKWDKIPRNLVNIISGKYVRKQRRTRVTKTPE